jgi:hypothetical protein
MSNSTNERALPTWLGFLFEEIGHARVVDKTVIEGEVMLRALKTVDNNKRCRKY